MRPTPVDLRLVPAAAACWGACLAGVRLAPPVAATVAGVLAVAATAAVGSAGSVRRGSARAGHDRDRTPRPAATARPGVPARGRPGGGPDEAAGDRAAERRARGPAARGHVVLVLVVVAAGLVSAGSQRTARDAGPLAGLVDEHALVRVVGVVRSAPVPLRGGPDWRERDGDRVRVDVALERVTGRGRTGRAAATVLVLAGPGWAGVAYGARVEALGRLEPTGPGDRARAVLLVRGPPTVRTAPHGLHGGVRTVRQALLRVTDPLPSDARGLVPGAAIGDTSRVPDDLDAALRVAGLTHITAVSGAHFAIVGAVVLALTAAAGMPRAARAGVVGLAMVGFVVLVHPAPSVLRAAMTGAVGVAALVLGRPSRAVPALAASVVVLLVTDPWLSGSIGFTLSVVATAGIALGSGPIARVLARRLPERAARLLAVPLAAQCAVGPVVAALGPGLPGYAVPANLAAAPAVPPATVLGVAGALLAPWWEGGAAVCVRAAGWATWWIATVARTTAALPGAQVPWPDGPVGSALLAVATAGVVVALARPWRRTSVTAPPSTEGARGWAGRPPPGSGGGSLGRPPISVGDDPHHGGALRAPPRAARDPGDDRGAARAPDRRSSRVLRRPTG